MNDTTIDTPVATGGKDKGFTLVELLIVIVILGVLATVTVFAVRGITNRGEQTACEADYKTLETAIETWHAEAADEKEDVAPLGVPSMDELVPDFLRSASDNYGINATGDLIMVNTARVEVTDPDLAVCRIPT